MGLRFTLVIASIVRLNKVCRYVKLEMPLSLRVYQKPGLVRELKRLSWGWLLCVGVVLVLLRTRRFLFFMRRAG